MAGSRFYARLNRTRWQATRRRVFERDGWRCVKCGKAGRLEAHHVIPLDKGGAPYDEANAETLCRDCHIDVHRRSPGLGVDAWRTLLRELVDTP